MSPSPRASKPTHSRKKLVRARLYESAKVCCLVIANEFCRLKCNEFCRLEFCVISKQSRAMLSRAKNQLSSRYVSAGKSQLQQNIERSLIFYTHILSRSCKFTLIIIKTIYIIKYDLVMIFEL